MSHRFLYVNKKNYDVYKYKKGQKYLILQNPKLIKEYHRILFALINYKWTQQLEKFNSSPRISKKVNGSDREDIKRNLSR